MPRREPSVISSADLIGTSDAAKILNISPTRLRQLAASGRITPVARIPPRGSRLYSRLDVERFRDDRRRNSKSAA